MNDLREITTHLIAGNMVMVNSLMAKVSEDSDLSNDKAGEIIAGHANLARAIIDATPDPEPICTCSPDGCYFKREVSE